MTSSVWGRASAGTALVRRRTNSSTRKRLGMFCLLAGLAASHAYADEYSGPYLGASVGQSRFAVEESPFHETDSAFKAFGGYAFSDLFAIEVAYIDGGTPTLETQGGDIVEATISGTSASVLLRARKGSAFALFLKLGYASYDIESVGTVNGATVVEPAESQQDFAYGIGASYLFDERFILRIEYEGIGVSNADLNFLTLGAGYKFSF